MCNAAYSFSCRSCYSSIRHSRSSISNHRWTSRYAAFHHHWGDWKLVGRVRHEGNVTVLRPLKLLPRILGDAPDRFLQAQVIRAAKALGVHRPTLWVNDANYAGLVTRTQWPALYDVTDDWLLASMTRRERRRLAERDRSLLEIAQVVVVCSPNLAKSRGQRRAVELIPNGVDTALFRDPQPRPSDLPKGPIALYAGVLHEDRLDIELCVELATRHNDICLVLVGPDALRSSTSARLRQSTNVHTPRGSSLRCDPELPPARRRLVVPHLERVYGEP